MSGTPLPIKTGFCFFYAFCIEPHDTKVKSTGQLDKLRNNFNYIVTRIFYRHTNDNPISKD
jgi:hypothetical protein